MDSMKEEKGKCTNDVSVVKEYVLHTLDSLTSSITLEKN